MAHTLIGWLETQDTGGVLTYVAGLPDQHVRVEGDNIIVPREMNKLIGYYAGGAAINNARLESPRLRRIVNLDLFPLNVGGEPNSPPAISLFPNSPITLDEDEALRALVSETYTGAEREIVLAWLADDVIEPVTGEIFTVRANGSTALVANTWSNVQLTFAQTLPAGKYQVVGMAAMSDNCIAARLVFVGGKWRPGCLGQDSVSDIGYDVFRHGRLGVWGEFEATQPPSADFLATAADTSETVILDIMYLGE